MDLDAILQRRPEVVLVDELAHTNAPGSRHTKRWQDVEVLLDAGIDVISTVNIQHLESMNDVVAQITGIEQREVIPDAVVRAAEQVQLVDQTPEALRRRLAHGNVYPAERVDAALDNYFREGNLSALRELALMWVADRVDEGLRRYREDHGITDTWETKERVVVAVTGAPGNEDLIRRAARMATRSRGELLGAHIRSEDGLADHRSSVLERNRALLKDLGGEYHEIAAGDVAGALVRFARSHNATQIVLGASGRSRWAELTSGSVINEVVRRSGEIDVHVISQTSRDGHADGGPESTGPDRSAVAGEAYDVARAPGRWQRLSGSAAFSRRRLQVGWLLAIALPLTATALLLLVDPWIDLPADLLTYTLVVTVVAVVGGLLPAAVSASISFLLANWFFTPPVHTWTVGEPGNLLALLLFLADAAIIGVFVTIAGRRAAMANAARADAETLAAIAGAAVSSERLLPTLVDRMLSALEATSVAVLRQHDGEPWEVVTAAGTEPPPAPAVAELAVELGDRDWLVVEGASPGWAGSPVFRAFCAQLAAALDREQLRVEADRAVRLEEADALRSGLLAAVSHDLRTPLASIRAAASTLHQPGVEWSPELHDEFVGEILAQTDRLTALVDNLLEMGRIHANAVQLHLRPVSLEEAVASATVGIDLRGVRLQIELDEDLPPVVADPPLLERALANLIDNALKWSPPAGTVRIDAAVLDSLVTLRVVDRGPGISRERRQEVFRAFQRLDDTSGIEGTGLGLAVAHGFVTLMGGSILVEDTPGGGTTMVVLLPRDGAPTADDSPVSEDPTR
jgi:two-component system sensor histidine kinase KdpD